MRLRDLRIKLQRIDQIIAQFRLFLLDKKRGSFLREAAHEAETRPADNTEQYRDCEHTIDQRRIGKSGFYLENARAESEQQSRADCYQAQCLEPLKKSEAPDEAPQERG